MSFLMLILPSFRSVTLPALTPAETPPAGADSLLLEDSASYLLMEDSASKISMES